MTSKPKRIVLTGAHSGGKTTILEELKSQGFYVGEEESRKLKEKLKAENSDLTPEKNLNGFERLLLERKVDEYLNGPLNRSSPYNAYFFDRGIPDAIAFYRQFGIEPPKDIVDACRNYRYDAVFLVPPWKEIYKKSWKRPEDFEEAVKIHEQIKSAYTELGYNPIEIPKCTVKERAEFVKSKIEELYSRSDSGNITASVNRQPA